MSGIRAVFASRIPSNLPRRKLSCTPAHEGQTFGHQVHVEDHPATRRRAARRARVAPHAYVFRPSRRDGFVHGVSHPSHGRAHPSTQGHDFSSSLLVRVDVRRRRVLVPSVARRAVCFCEVGLRATRFVLQVRADVVWLERTPALRAGAWSFGCRAATLADVVPCRTA
jgi:hypothetical protein